MLNQPVPSFVDIANRYIVSLRTAVAALDAPKSSR